jgi:hypothetical protein
MPSKRVKYESYQLTDTAHARNTVAEKCGKIKMFLKKVKNT